MAIINSLRRMAGLVWKGVWTGAWAGVRTGVRAGIWAAICTGAVHGVSAPDEHEVKRVFNRHYGQRLLFFKPHEMPQEVERTHKELVNELDKWVTLGLLTRENTRFLAEKMMYGSLREVSVGGYKYSLNRTSEWVSELGFYYGRPRRQQVLNVSKPSHINANYFSEVYFTWYVADPPPWLASIKPDARSERLLRRAKESEQRPFEKRMYLVFKEGKWDLWLEKGDQPLFK